MFTQPPDAVLVGGATQSLFVLLTGTAIAMNMGCVALSTFLIMQLNLMCDDEVVWFVHGFSAYTGLGGLPGMGGMI